MEDGFVLAVIGRCAVVARLGLATENTLPALRGCYLQISDFKLSECSVFFKSEIKAGERIYNISFDNPEAWERHKNITVEMP